MTQPSIPLAPQPLPLHCANCDKDVHPAITLNDAAQVVKACPRCQSVLGGAVSGQLFKTGATPRALAQPEPPLPNVLPARGQLPGGQVVQIRRGPDPAHEPSRSLSREDIVERARIELAEEEARIPGIEGELARAKANCRGLTKMIAAYERGASTKPRG